MEIQQVLSTLGLNDKEARVYSALLQLGSATAYAVAQKSGLKRPTVYVILDELRLRGLVLKSPNARRTTYTAKMPDELIAEAENKLYQAKAFLPQLLAMAAKEKKIQTLYFEGVNGLKEMYDIGTKRMKEEEIDTSHVMAARSKIEKEPAYSKVTARLLLDSLYRESVGIKTSHPQLKNKHTEYFQWYIKHGITIARIGKDLLMFDLAGPPAVGLKSLKHSSFRRAAWERLP